MTGNLIRIGEETQTHMEDSHVKRDIHRRMWWWRQRLDWCVYKPRNTKDFRQPWDARKRQGKFSSKAFRESMALITPWFFIFIVQNYGRIDFCYVKPLNLWYFVTAPLGKQYTIFLWFWSHFPLCLECPPSLFTKILSIVRAVSFMDPSGYSLSLTYPWIACLELPHDGAVSLLSSFFRSPPKWKLLEGRNCLCIFHLLQQCLVYNACLDF